MKADVTHTYHYVKIDDHFFCLQQNPVLLAWILFFKRDNLITIQPWLKKSLPRWKMIYYRYRWKTFKRNLTNLVIFVKCRIGGKNLDTVCLPVYGHFGMSVHKGYKIFNLRARTVTKIFDPDVDKTSISREIDQLKKVSQINFAPSLKRWDIDERWYQEDYFKSSIASAHRSADSATLLKAFHEEAMPCMNNLMSYQRLLTKDLHTYLEELNGVLDISRLLIKESNLIESKICRDFVSDSVGQLNAQRNHPVYLAFTHGDFCPANFLSTRDGLKIVDWETAAYRSLLFDFYSYFFYRVTSGKLPVEQIVSEINEALPHFVSRLSLRIPELSGIILSMINIYRRLFYIEYICKLVERDVTDNRLNMTDYMVKYIKAFREYEIVRNANVMAENSKTTKEVKVVRQCI